MQKKLLMGLIKSKLKSKKNIDKLIDEFVKSQSSKAVDHLEEFLSDLFIYINKNFDEIEKESLLTIVSSKLKDLNVSFNTKDIDLIYEKLSIVNTAAVTNVSTSFVFNKIDLKAIESMRNGFQWVGTEYNAKTQDKLKGVIKSAFKGDITREAISSELKKEFEGIVSGDRKYFEGVADHIINQSQNISRVNQALKYEVEHFKVVARIDKKTSIICRSMHGKIIEASHLKNQVENIVGAKSIGEKKGAASWSSNPIYGKLSKNFGLPPYHFRCRTEIVPVWLQEDVIDGKKVKYANKKENDIITHIDKTGVQRRLSKKNWDKHIDVSREGQLKYKEVISSLNSITDIAPHNTNPLRTVAKSANGNFLVFEADELVTIFPMSKKNYFKDNSIYDKKEIIKWKKESLLSRFGKMLIGK